MDEPDRHPRDALPGVLVGELDPEEAAGVAAHLQRCDDCRRDLASIAFAAAALRTAARAPFAEAARLPPVWDPPIENSAFRRRVRRDGSARGRPHH